MEKFMQNETEITAPDVFIEEPPPKENKVVKHENVIPGICPETILSLWKTSISGKLCLSTRTTIRDEK